MEKMMTNKQFTLYYGEYKKMPVRAGYKYSTGYYNGIKLTAKKSLTHWCRDIIQAFKHLCDVELNNECILDFHSPSKLFPMDTSHGATKKYRTPLQALEEFYEYITQTNTTGGIPQAMIDRWNRVWETQDNLKIFPVDRENNIDRYATKQDSLKVDETFNKFFG